MVRVVKEILIRAEDDVRFSSPMEGRPIIGGACAQHDKSSTAVKIQDGYVLSNSMAKHLLAQAFPDCQEKQLQGHVEDVSVVRKMGAAAGYGEIPFASAAKLLRRLELTQEDTFFDLGSGVGKFCLQAFLAQKVGSIVGVEMGPTRHAAAIAGRQALAGLLSSLDAQLDAGFCAGGVQVLGGRPSTNSNFLQQKGLGAYHCRRSAAMQSQNFDFDVALIDGRWTVVMPHADPQAPCRKIATRPEEGSAKSSTCFAMNSNHAAGCATKPKDVEPESRAALWQRQNSYVFRRMSRRLLSGGVDFRCVDMHSANLRAATVIYCASALFSDQFLLSLLAKLSREATSLRWLLTLSRLPEGQSCERNTSSTDERDGAENGMVLLSAAPRVVAQATAARPHSSRTYFSKGSAATLQRARSIAAASKYEVRKSESIQKIDCGGQSRSSCNNAAPAQQSEAASRTTTTSGGNGSAKRKESGLIEDGATTPSTPGIMSRESEGAHDFLAGMRARLNRAVYSKNNKAASCSSDVQNGAAETALPSKRRVYESSGTASEMPKAKDFRALPLDPPAARGANDQSRSTMVLTLVEIWNLPQSWTESGTVFLYRCHRVES